MRKLIGLNLLCGLALSCTPTQDGPILKKGQAMVTGIVSNYQGNPKTISFSAQGAVDPVDHSIAIDSGGRFRAEIELYHPQNVYLAFHKGHGKLFLYPQDSLHLELDHRAFSKEQFPHYAITGEGESVKFSESIRDYFRYTGKNSFYPDPTGKSADEFLALLQQEISRRDSMLQKFCTAKKAYPGFKDWQRRDTRYDVANTLIYFTVAHRNYEGNVFDTFLFPVDDDWAITSDLYGLHLKHYASHLGFGKDSLARSHLEAGQKLLAYRSCLDKLISHEKQGLSRDLMCYKTYLALLQDSFKDFSVLLEDGDVYIKNKILTEALKRRKTAFEGMEKMAIRYLDPETKIEKEIRGEFWKHLQKKYKGKVVYVDIYADWCGPCRSEPPHALELHGYFEGQDIAFVHLCMASEKDDWRRFIESRQMKGDHYFFNQAQTQKFRAHFTFQGYPTYLILDKGGRLIEKNAPRPSSKDHIRLRLAELIKESNPDAI